MPLSLAEFLEWDSVLVTREQITLTKNHHKPEYGHPVGFHLMANGKRMVIAKDQEPHIIDLLNHMESLGKLRIELATSEMTLMEILR